MWPVVVVDARAVAILLALTASVGPYSLTSAAGQSAAPPNGPGQHRGERGFGLNQPPPRGGAATPRIVGPRKPDTLDECLALVPLTRQNVLAVMGPQGLAARENERMKHFDSMNIFETIEAMCKADHFDMAFINARNVVQALQQKLSPPPSTKNPPCDTLEEFDLRPCE